MAATRGGGELTPRGRISLVAGPRRENCSMQLRDDPKTTTSGSVFQENNHLFLRDKITLQSLVNMNDH